MQILTEMWTVAVPSHSAAEISHPHLSLQQLLQLYSLSCDLHTRFIGRKCSKSQKVINTLFHGSYHAGKNTATQ